MVPLNERQGGMLPASPLELSGTYDVRKDQGHQTNLMPGAELLEPASLVRNETVGDVAYGPPR
jgi:hypothetical protein